MARKNLQGDARRKQILDCIINFISENGYSPTIRELCEMTGIKSTSTMHSHLLRMNNDGVITSGIDKPRTIKVTGYKYEKECESIGL